MAFASAKPDPALLLDGKAVPGMLAEAAMPARKYRTIAIHVCEAARQKAYAIAKSPQFAEALRKRRKVEALFSDLKNLVGLRRLWLRRIKFVRAQF